MLVLAIASAGCGASTPDNTPTRGAFPTPGATDTPGATPDPGGTSATRIDRSLLGVLPAQIGVVVLEEESTVEAGMIESPGVVAIGDALAVARFGDAAGENVALASVLRFRGTARSEDTYRDYVLGYVTSACEANGGVENMSQTEIAGRRVETATCQGGAEIFLVRLGAGSVAVSVLSLGPAGFGRTIIANLRE